MSHVPFPYHTRRLGYFVSVCEHSGISKAASAIGVAQPALTRQIKLLEHYPYKGQTMTALRRALHPQRQDDAVMLTHLQAMSLALGKQIFLQQLSVVRADGHQELTEITCPALVVASRNDQMRTLAESEKLASGLPYSSLRIVEDCGHMSPLEKAPELITVLDNWLKRSRL